MTPKIARFLAERQPETPCLVVDLDVIADNYARLHESLPLADIYYAVKANPARPVLERLRDLGSYFDTASIYEIEQCLDLGIPAARMSFGSTIKKERDIARAYEAGIDLYAFDSPAELEKIARAAPGAKVFCRLFMDGAGADWPLSHKFGCDVDMAQDMLLRCPALGLQPWGVSFHVGSQQTDPGQWDIAVGKTHMLFTALRDSGIELKMINLGGGFPARYSSDVPDGQTYADAIMATVTRHFGNALPHLIVEPGRGIAGDAGVIQTEIVLISYKSYEDPVRWIFLDVGKFGGLPETMDEAIKYRITSRHDGDLTGPVILAGPTCDEVDVLYEEHKYDLPLSLKVGDKIEFLSAGAYTSTYASVGFNGFPPLKEYCI